jgi:hypothetical protein
MPAVKGVGDPSLTWGFAIIGRVLLNCEFSPSGFPKGRN